MSSSFEQLGLNPGLIRTITALGFEEPTPIQQEAIPHLLAGRDLIGCARTGTGKTAAYTLPLLQLLDPGLNAVQLLVLTPTRELAVQVAEAVHTFTKGTGLQVLPVYGGQPLDKQARRLERGVAMVTGTPGRLLDLLERGVLKLDKVKALVLDECDEMLDMGFVDDVTRLMDATPKTRQTAFFSATLSHAVQNLSRKHLKNPVQVIVENQEERPREIDQRACLVTGRRNKTQVLVRFLEIEAPTAVLIFTRTKQGADQLVEELAEAGYSADVYHGDLTQSARESVIRKFRNRGLDLLVATDVAARGLDIEQITHVVNYDAPPSAQTYVHRVGRTGRAGRQGVAITLLEPIERRQLRLYEKAFGQPISLVSAPTPKDVQAAQRKRLENNLRELLAQPEVTPVDAHQELIEQLAQEYDPLAIARATLSLFQPQKVSIPVTTPPPPATNRPKREIRTGNGGEQRFEARGGNEQMVRLHIGAGRDAGLRPGDIVGAIANECGIPGRTIGAIEIRDTHAFVEVREQDSASVLNLKYTTLRGRPVAFALAEPDA